METVIVEESSEKQKRRELAELIATDPNVREIMRFAGSSKEITTDEELHQIRERVFWEQRKKNGWD